MSDQVWVINYLVSKTALKQLFAFYFFLLLNITIPANANEVTELFESPSVGYEGLSKLNNITFNDTLTKILAKTRKNIVYVSNCAILDKNDTLYIVDKDIVADETAFIIKSNNVTLDLNGHTVTYNDKADGFGISLATWWQKDIEIINGTIKQGKANCKGNSNGIGCNPIHTLSGKNLLIANLKLIWQGDDVNGMNIQHQDTALITNNFLHDLGDKVSNRHQGIVGISMNGGANIVVSDNYLYRSRNRGIRITAENPIVEKNRVNIDSVATNSTGINTSSGVIRFNKVFGKGAHPIGIWPGPGVQVYGNYVEVQNTMISNEYKSAGAACLRMTWGQEDGVEVWNNTFYLKAKKDGIAPGIDSWGRALFVGLPKPEQRAFFHHNIIIGDNGGDGSKAPAVAMVCLNNSDKFVFEDNVIASNWAPILLGDSYGGSGGFPLFRRNKIVKLYGSNDFHTIRSQYRDYASTAVLISNTYENGASQDDIQFELPSSAIKEVRFGHMLIVSVNNSVNKPVSNAKIEVNDSKGNIVFQGSTSDKGTCHIQLISRTISNKFDIVKTKLSDVTDFKFKVRVSFDGKEVEQEISLTGDRNMEVTL